MTDGNRLEKLALLAIAALGIIVLWQISYKALANEIGANAATTIGVIATGILAIVKDIIQAIRGYSMSAQLGKVTDQLAASGPVQADAVQDVRVTNDSAEPVPVESK